MELDLKVCIPQLSYQKNLRLSTPLISLRQLENQIRDRVPTLPQNLTYHSTEDPTSPTLDICQPIKNFGYGFFMQENKGLYIYYNEDDISYNNSLESSVEIISSQNSYNQRLFSTESPPQTAKKKNLDKIPEVVCIDEDILVTILNPYLATNNIFNAKGSLKISVLLQEYEKRIEWNPERPKLCLAKSEGAEIINPFPAALKKLISPRVTQRSISEIMSTVVPLRYGTCSFFKNYKNLRHVLYLGFSRRERVNEGQSLADITKEDEVILWVRQVGEAQKKKKIVKRSHSQLGNEQEDSDVEIIEKKIKPLEENKATASVSKIMVMKSPNRMNGEENKSATKSSVKIKTKTAKRSHSDIGISPEQEKDEISTNESSLNQFQILENINRNFDKLIDYQRIQKMQTKIIKKATPNINTRLATTPDKPLVIEEDPSE